LWPYRGREFWSNRGVGAWGWIHDVYFASRAWGPSKIEGKDNTKNKRSAKNREVKQFAIFSA
jgi:hypothetical protein